MSRASIPAGFFRPWPGLAVLLLAALGSGAPVCCAAESSVVRVEEDWELVINQPDPSIHSPQITFYVTPSPTDPDRYFQLQLNHAIEHDFSGGGFHVAAMQGPEHLDCVRSDTYQPLVTHDQVLRWTSVMAVSGGEMFFAVKNGYCVDWGTFGGAPSLVRMPAVNGANLNNYDFNRSLEMVDVGFGGNRVESLALKSVRVYYADGRINEVVVNRSP